MVREESPDIDDELFNEVYGKEYTAPVVAVASKQLQANKKRSLEPNDDGGGGGGDEDEPRDPNAVPTDFTSREARVREAKAKANEKIWKKKKEEEMICKLCGESGHFTQGCPSTLGTNRKSADFFERVPARDKNVRALFSNKAISQIEKVVGCKIKMEEKFLIVSGRDRLILAKGIGAVHKLIQDDKGKKSSPASSHKTRSKSPDRGPMSSHYSRSDSLKSRSSPRNTSRIQSRSANQERLEDNVRQDLHMLSRGSPQARAYANRGAKGHSARSKSPIRSSLGGDDFRSYVGQSHNPVVLKNSSLDYSIHGTNSHSKGNFDLPAYPQTMEELEMELKREVMELGRGRDKEEDDENYKHRECISGLRENHMKKLANLRGMHAKQWEEFLERSIQMRQQTRHDAYNHHPAAYADHEPSRYLATSSFDPMSMDSKSRYPFSYPDPDKYSASRSRDDAYGDIHPHQGRGDNFGQAYRQY